MKVLVTVAFHYNSNRVNQFKKVIDNYKSYGCEVDVVVYTNDNSLEKINFNDIKIIVCDNLSHPFHLTWKPREYISEKYKDYDWIIYQEDDILIPPYHFVHYINRFNELYNEKCMPSFVQIEELNNEKYIVNFTKQITKEIITINNERYFSPIEPYNAFWILPKKVINDNIKNFVRLSDSREFAAHYPMSELKLKPLISLNSDDQIFVKCYAYHLTNNYVLTDSPFAKIKVNEVFRD